MTTAAARRLLLFPCNGNAREAVDALDERYQLVGFIDDAPERRRERLYGFPVFDRAALAEYPDAVVLAVPGGPRSYLTRRAIIEGLGIGYRFIVDDKGDATALEEIHISGDSRFARQR